MRSQEHEETTQTYDQWLRSMHGGAIGRRTAESHASFLMPHLRPGMRLLDAGCGPGSITIGLAQAVAPGEAIGIDASEESIEMARALADERGVANVRFDVGDVYALPFEDATFDAAFIHNVLQHLADPLAALREIRRVMKPGSVIGVGDADLQYGHMIHPTTPALDAAMELTVRLRERNGGTPDAGRRLRELLAEAGFVRTTASVVAECDATSEATQRTGDFQAYYITAAPFVARVTEFGLASEQELSEMAEAWRAWGRSAGALWVRLGCRAVGWAQ